MKRTLDVRVTDIGALSSVIDRYDGFLLDLWGVVHNGVAVFDHARDCLVRLREKGRRVVFLSNAPRRSGVIARQLSDFGIEPALYDGVLSSGEDAWQHLRRDPVYAALGRRCFSIGPERDASMLDGLELDVAGSPEEADFILNSGPWGAGDGLADYEDILRRGTRASIPMICLNPDLEVIRGTKRMICAGALAQRYAQLGGDVIYHGKPYRGIYDQALVPMMIEDRRRILAIGDSLRTDIQGAREYGIDSLLVLDGIHRRDGMVEDRIDPKKCRELWRKNGLRPDMMIRRLEW